VLIDSGRLGLADSRWKIGNHIRNNLAFDAGRPRLRFLLMHQRKRFYAIMNWGKKGMDKVSSESKELIFHINMPPFYGRLMLNTVLAATSGFKL
jgi:hypothetical protein